MGSDANDKKNAPRKVIDMTERLEAKKAANSPIERLKNLKVRLDLEQAKIAIPMSLLSIMIIVTVANSELLKSDKLETRELASQGEVIPARGIASVPAGTSEEEDRVVKQMAERTLSEAAAIGRRPAALEKFRLETLEGKYAVRLDDHQKLSEIEIDQARLDQPVSFGDRFLDSNRELMPVEFEKSVRVQNKSENGSTLQTYHLVNGLSMPLAKVDVRLDSEGRLLGLKVSQTK